MSNKIKRILLEDVFLLIYITVFIFTVGGLQTYQKEKLEIDLLSNDLYSPGSVKFFADSPEPLQLKEFSDKYNYDYLLHKEDIGFNINGVYVYGDPFQIPIKSGRFFKPEDFHRGKFVAVIGDSYRDIVTVNDKKYVEYGPAKFEVIGILGGKINSEATDKAYLNLDAVYKIGQLNSAGPYIVDGSSSSQKVFHSLKDFEAGIIDFNEIQSDSKGTGRLVDNNIFWTMILLSIICITVNLMVLSFWCYKKRVLVSIYTLTGYPFILCAWLIAGRFSTLLFTSLVLGSVLSAISYSPANIFSFGTVGVVSVFCFFNILIVISACHLMMKNSLKVLK